jgi:hypothetical protein
MHTMFKIQPQQTECDWHMMSRGGVFLDATGKQYWFVPGLRRVEEYPFDIRPEYTKAQEVRDLGFEYREHLQDLNTPIDDGRDGEHDKRCSGYVNEVMFRTINHATHEAVSTSGGPKAFLSLDDASYVAAEHTLLSAVFSSLTSQQAAVNRILDLSGERLRMNEARKLAKSCASGGHLRIISALCRVSEYQGEDYIWVR